MKKYLSDSYILSWNDRLKNSNYQVMPRYHTHQSFPVICFYQKTSGPFTTGELVPTFDPPVKFQFSFSVAKNRVDNFFLIFNKWFTNKIETKTLYDDRNTREKMSDIIVSDSVIKNKKIEDHKVKDKEYSKFTYEFDANLSSIMAYIMFLEDTIDIFSQIWGYDEEGGEHVLTKFNIGDIVTKNGDQTEDYIILDFSPKKTDSKFTINYEICKMITKGQIIQYSPSEIVNQNEITWSRNNRINDILDK